MSDIPPGRPISRRRFLRGVGAAGVGIAAARVAGASGLGYLDTSAQPGSPLAGFDYPTALPLPFAHGVASGDPLEDRVILWTRITQVAPAGPVAVGWQVAKDPAMQRVVASGLVQTDAARDWTVKVDAAGLEPTTTYYYAFHALGETSIVGRTKTAPRPGSSAPVRFAVLSSYSLAAPHNHHALVGARDDLDAVIHCGDPLYDRTHEATHPAGTPEIDVRDCRTLDEVRRRHALHHADMGVCRARQQHPFIALWDQHDPPTADIEASVADRQKAFWEWMPARPPSPDGREVATAPGHTQLDTDDASARYRRLRYGNNAELFLLDARGDQNGPLDRRQQDWLSDATWRSSQAGVAWRLVVNQTLMGDLNLRAPAPHAASHGAATTHTATNTWDAPHGQRDALLTGWRERGVRDTIVVTADMHVNWIGELAPRAGPGADATPIAVEFGAASAPRQPAPAPLADATSLEVALRRANSHLRFVECAHHGYGLLHLDGDEARLEFWWPGEEAGTEALGGQARVERGRARPIVEPHARAWAGETLSSV